tara:strand:- start:427 stop:627 length:201 start_codon:yes stop_codon:yes gene_type:complete
VGFELNIMDDEIETLQKRIDILELQMHLLMKHFADDPEIATLIREMKALDAKQTTLIPRSQKTLFS